MATVTATDSGTVVEVSTVTLGDELASDHAAGSLYGGGTYGQGAYGEGPFGGGVLAIVVKDAADFSDDGGWLTIGDETVFYTSAEDDEDNDVGILYLAEPLTGGYVEGDRVDLFPPSYEKYAQVMVGDFGEAVEVEVPHGLWNKIADGVRADGDGEVVTFHLEGGSFVLDEPVGQKPIVDGGYLDQETTPPEAWMDGSLYATIGFVDGGFVAGDPFGAYVQMSAEGITAANEAGEQTFQIDALTGNVTTVGLFASALVPDEPHVVVGDLAGTGTDRAFMYFYTGQELDTDGIPVAGYWPGEVSSGIDDDGTRYIRLASPDAPSMMSGVLTVRSSVDASTPPAMEWSGDIRLRGTEGILYALNASDARAPLTIQGSALVLDVPNGTIRLSESTATSSNRLRSRDSADTARRQLELEADTILFDVTGANLRLREAANFTASYGQFTAPDGNVSVIWTNTDTIRIGTNAGDGFQPIAASAFNVNSDKAKKTDEIAVDPAAALEAISGLTVYDYTRTDNGRKQRGVMAQDVAEVLPAASEELDGDWTVELYALCTTTTAAVQALAARVTALEGKPKAKA